MLARSNNSKSDGRRIESAARVQSKRARAGQIRTCTNRIGPRLGESSPGRANDKIHQLVHRARRRRRISVRRGGGRLGIGCTEQSRQLLPPSLSHLARWPPLLSLSALIPPTFSSPLRLFLIHGNSLGALRSCLPLFRPRQTTTRPRNGWRFSDRKNVV